jgi:hypothetical protein
MEKGDDGLHELRDKVWKKVQQIHENNNSAYWAAIYSNLTTLEDPMPQGINKASAMLLILRCQHVERLGNLLTYLESQVGFLDTVDKDSWSWCNVL